MENGGASSSLVSSDRSVMLDVSLAVEFVKAIHARVPNEVAAEIVQAFAAFEEASEREEAAEKLATVVRERLKGHPDLLEKLNFYFPKEVSLLGAPSSHDNEQPQGDLDQTPIDALPNGHATPVKRSANDRSWMEYTKMTTPVDLGRADQAFRKLAEEVDEDAIRAFLRILDQYNTVKITRQEFITKVPPAILKNELFSESILKFMETHQPEQNREMLSRFQRRSNACFSTPRVSKSEIQLSLKLRNLEKQVGNPEVYASVVETIKAYTDGVTDLVWLKAVLLDDLKNRPQTDWDALQELLREFDKIRTFDASEQSRVRETLKMLITKEEEGCHLSISDLDVQSCERCTPSYIHVPALYTTVPKSRSKLADSVLNDHLMCVSTGTEDTETEQWHNVSEHRMYEMETEMWTAELNIGRLTSALKHLQRLSVEMEPLSDADARALLEREGITKNAVQQRLLMTLYIDHFEKLKEAVFDNPKKGVSVVSETLQTKIDEWMQVLANQTPSWQLLCQKHHRRSLDYTCQIFQDNEKRQLSYRSQLNEINLKAKNERKRKPSKLFALCDLRRQIRRPHLRLDFGKRDSVRLCTWSVLEGIQACHKASDVDRALHFWDSFLSFFLATHSNQPPSISVPGGCSSSHDVEKIKSEVMMEDPSGRQSVLSQSSETSAGDEFLLYCDEQFYHLFSLLHVLYSRCEELSLLLVKPEEQKDAALQLISGFLNKKMEQIEFEDKMCQLLGNDAYPLYTIADVISKTVAPMSYMMDSVSMQMFTRALMASNDSGVASSNCMTLKDYLEKTKKPAPSLDDLHYFSEASERFPNSVSFRMAFSCTTRVLSIRKVDEDAEQLPFLGKIITASRSVRKPVPDKKRISVYLTRNLRGLLDQTRFDKKAWPRYISSAQQKLKANSNQIVYRENTEDWMLSLNRGRPTDVGQVEKKTRTMLSWIKDQLQTFPSPQAE